MARRTDDPSDVHLVIHGHFYQPPRENPWLETIEREPGAAPYPNWNALITDQCYCTNGWARIYDDKGRIEQIINNYLYLSFNFGPTLLVWLEEAMPEVYARILEADRLSQELRSGHGNALAQSYGHAILPLCNSRDRLTLIRWGVQDFRHRFGRDPEGLWLPETAIDEASLEDLIAEDIRFVVLSPYQAARVRTLHKEQWTDVSGGAVDPRMPYRCTSRKDPGRSLDVFFYDGPVSHAMSFERVLKSSRQFVDRLWGAVDGSRGSPQLVNAAVDGETFGHHLRNAERTLAYAFTEEIPKRGFKVTNYGEYLEQNPPTHEVELEPGPGGEGTAWSCAHGVGRWYRDCGCNIGAPEGWNQKWRGPLREAVNLVRDEAERLLEQMGGELLRDPWAARDHYVELLLDRSPEGRLRFLEQHGRVRRGVGRQVRVFKLLEMHRFSLLAQTSCGWFFNDIAGLEATQVLKYTARAVQLLDDLSGRDVEGRVLKLLEGARSNKATRGTGADVYRDRVLSSQVDVRRLTAQYAIMDMIHSYPADLTLHSHHIHRVERHRLSSGPLTLMVGRVEVESLLTMEAADLTYVLIHFGSHDFHCAVRSFPGIQAFHGFTSQLEEIFERATITDLLRAVDAHFGDTYYDLPQLLSEQREEVLDHLFEDTIERFAGMYTRLYMQHRRTVSALIDSGLKVPREFRMAAEYTLSRQFNEEVHKQQQSRDRHRYHWAMELADEAAHGGYELDLSESEELFGRMLNESIEAFMEAPSRQACHDALDLFLLADMLKLTIPLDRPLELLYQWLVEQGGPEPESDYEEQLDSLLARVQISPKLLPKSEEASG